MSLITAGKIKFKVVNGSESSEIGFVLPLPVSVDIFYSIMDWKNKYEFTFEEVNMFNDSMKKFGSDIEKHKNDLNGILEYVDENDLNYQDDFYNKYASKEGDGFKDVHELSKHLYLYRDFCYNEAEKHSGIRKVYYHHRYHTLGLVLNHLDYLCQFEIASKASKQVYNDGDIKLIMSSTLQGVLNEFYRHHGYYFSMLDRESNDFQKAYLTGKLNQVGETISHLEKFIQEKVNKGHKYVAIENNVTAESLMTFNIPAVDKESFVKKDEPILSFNDVIEFIITKDELIKKCDRISYNLKLMLSLFESVCDKITNRS